MSAIALAAALGGLLYLLLADVRLAAFALRRPRYATMQLPSFTILKPVAGLEPDLYENLASFCEQEYRAAFEVVFCLHRADDPALETVERLVRRYPWCGIEIAIGHNPAMRNPKIANLAKPGVPLRGEIVVVADSDVRVGPRYLRALAASFADERTGAVTCLYRGLPNRRLVSRLGAMGIDDGFAPSVLVATALGKLRFCLGATMAVRRALLERIGGLEALGHELADDHRLGELVAAAGSRVVLSRYVVATTVPETTPAQLFSHELRWARTNRALAPVGYAFSFLMYALPLAALYLAWSRNLAYGVPLVALALLLRLLLHVLARAALRADGPDDLWMIPLRDLSSLGVWAASLLGRGVRWRRITYRLGSRAPCSPASEDRRRSR